MTKGIPGQLEKEPGTYLYLAYGSNLSFESFQNRRGIKPFGQLNVQVETLRLTFDLPGIPYAEPCFANSGIRDPARDDPIQKPDDKYNKDRWHKGLIGVVYEITPQDFARVIATEGGGSSYQDILVLCHPLPNADTVPDVPATPPFKAHTLLSPALPNPKPSDPPPKIPGGRFQRPDPSYAQPSARYLELIKTGADELALPQEYKDYLHGIRPFTITTTGQRLGQFMFLLTWTPFILLLFALGRVYQDSKGRAPKWLQQLSAAIFTSVWRSYDRIFKPVFGDGERSIQDGGGNDGDDGEEGEVKILFDNVEFGIFP